MAPMRSKKRKSSETETSNLVVQFPAPPAITIPTKTGSPTKTPERRSPVKRTLSITQAQKQALIDNLQLEVTERARKLRAQYALHAQGLRLRFERRINRIPRALRSQNILDLINKYAEQITATKPAAPLTTKPFALGASKAVVPAKSPIRSTAAQPSPIRIRGTKRASTEISAASDKENVQADLNLPKKRAKTTAAAKATSASTAATRTTSRKVPPSQVLSPKSNNSRTLPRSPLKSGSSSPPKAGHTHRSSPLKAGTATSDHVPASLAGIVNGPGKPVRGTAATRAPSRQAQTAPTTASGRARRVANTNPAPPFGGVKQAKGRIVSSESQASDTSTGTTIVTKKKVLGTTARKAATGTAPAALGRKGATRKKEHPSTTTTAGTVRGGRLLRTRK